MENLEIYDEDTLNEFELKRQNNIIRNYEFFKLCGKNVNLLLQDSSPVQWNVIFVRGEVQYYKSGSALLSFLPSACGSGVV